VSTDASPHPPRLKLLVGSHNLYRRPKTIDATIADPPHRAHCWVVPSHWQLVIRANPPLGRLDGSLLSSDVCKGGGVWRGSADELPSAALILILTPALLSFPPLSPHLPIRFLTRPYGRVDRPRLKRKLLERCVEAGVGDSDSACAWSALASTVRAMLVCGMPCVVRTAVFGVAARAVWTLWG